MDKKVLFFTVVFAISFLLKFSIALSEDFTRMDFQNGKASIEIPSSWRIRDIEEEKGLTIIAPPTSENVGILVLLIEEGVSLNLGKEKLLRLITQKMHLESGPQLLGKGKTALRSGVEVFVERYSFVSGANLKGMLELFYGNVVGDGFVIASLVDGESYTKYSNTLTNIILSFTMASPKVSIPPAALLPILQLVPSRLSTPALEVSSESKSRVQEGWSSYVDPQGYFTLFVPSDWHRNPIPNPNVPVGIPYVNYVFVEGPKVSAHLSVMVESIPVGYTLQGYASAVEMSVLAKLHGYKKLIEAEEEINNRRFIRRVFTVESQAQDRKKSTVYAEQYYYVFVNLGYVLTLETDSADYHRFSPVFRSIVEAFQPLR